MGGNRPDLGPVVIARASLQADGLTNLHIITLGEFSCLDGAVGPRELDINLRDEIHAHATIKGKYHLGIDGLPVALYLDLDRPTRL